MIRAYEIEKAVTEHPDMDTKTLAKKLGVKIQRIYAARYRIEQRKKEAEKTKEYMRPVDNTPKAVKVKMRVWDKGEYKDYEGYDVSPFWGL